MANQDYSRTIADIKGPKGIPVFGNLFQIEREQIHQYYEQWAKEYGEFFFVNFLGKKILISSNPQNNAYILKNRPSKFRRLSKMGEIIEEIGFYGVFTAENEKWVKHRKVTQQALSNKNVKSFFPKIVQVAERLENYWDSNLNEEVKEYNISSDFTRATVDVTTNLAFGYDMNTVENHENEIQDHIAKIFPKVNQRINSPLPIWRYLKSSSDKDLDGSMAALKVTIGEFIAKAENNLKEDPSLKENPSNFIEALIASQDKEDPFSWDEIFGNIYTMLLAGEDTTANSLSWLTYFIASDSKLQSKVYQEIEHVLGNKEQITSFEEVGEFKFLSAVLKEVLRLKPVSPSLYFQANEDVVVGDLLIPKDTFVLTQLRVGALSEDNFENASEFIPERWLSAKDTSGGCPFTGKHKAEVAMPFGGGPRFCPGKFLSETEMILFAVTLLKKFELTLSVSKEEIKEKFAFTMSPENLSVNLKKRNSVSSTNLMEQNASI
ncbi:cytochrome P450 [Flammeovirga kamogawensis]|uniref:Cytochrome P450 n=1 Tax=Flammeovirga kamogawensis TaxID=373891 RepID=A0ABX8GVM3_9BACT|nr:cytochrome P450 [Flammeovirga kamogawensis]MBB6461080.1 cytochrome P450 [Flammeovirga kamogawensis]QWG07648.1 cytochrome P450 [Flammeovirga kamogawensis]TRX69458.1 cytochrome P450 [Flammeovirga kamogawensis]